MYVVIALIMMLAAIWIGLSFATRLVTPVRRLISATDQVATGNLYVQVPVHRSDGDLGPLGDTFNKMTSELRLQQNRLIAANQRRLQCLSLFWHFLDIAWIGIFSVVYLPGLI